MAEDDESVSEMGPRAADAVIALLSDYHHFADDGYQMSPMALDVLSDVLADRELTKAVIGSLTGLAYPTVASVAAAGFDDSWSGTMASLRSALEG